MTLITNYNKEMHSFIESKRLINRISYKKMGACIGYTDTGFQRALKGERLSLEHINVIVDKFGLRQEFETEFGKQDKEEEPSEDYSAKSKLLDEELEYELLRRWKT